MGPTLPAGGPPSGGGGAHAHGHVEGTWHGRVRESRRGSGWARACGDRRHASLRHRGMRHLLLCATITTVTLWWCCPPTTCMKLQWDGRPRPCMAASLLWSIPHPWHAHCRAHAGKQHRENRTHLLGDPARGVGDVDKERHAGVVQDGPEWQRTEPAGHASSGYGVSKHTGLAVMRIAAAGMCIPRCFSRHTATTGLDGGRRPWNFGAAAHAGARDARGSDEEGDAAGKEGVRDGSRCLHCSGHDQAEHLGAEDGA